MCGILMADSGVVDENEHVPKTKLTFEQAVAHIGGEGNLVSEHGRFLIQNHAHQYLWKYPDKKTHCTACGAVIDGFVGQHGRTYACPKCGARCEFRYEAKGHKYERDEFYLYEWRRSALDGEMIVLTGASVTRDSSGPMPHQAPLRVDPNAIYVFQYGKAATVYKQRWYWGAEHGEWELKKGAYPEHTRWGFKALDIVIDRGEFRRAIEGTRIGRLFDLLRDASGRWDDLELEAIHNCARRPWLEYLYKCGQRHLAGQLMRMERAGKDVIADRRARKPRALLGLTEAQWFEVKHDGIALTCGTLSTLRALEALDIGPVKLADAAALHARTHPAWYIERYLLPDGGSTSVCDRLRRLPDKPRRKILRRIVGDLQRAGDWRDYYNQLERLGELPTEDGAFSPDADLALLLPKDLARMHQRMTDRENALREEAQMKQLDGCQSILEKRLDKLRERYTFAACGLVLRPYETLREVVQEGQRLHICIGSYAERYAQGGTIICCLRRADAPDVSWRAVEFSAKSGKLVQDRGAYNDGRGIPTEDAEVLRTFWQAWNNRTNEKVRVST